MFSYRIVDFRFFVKFHRSGPAKIFISLTITENVSYASKKLLMASKDLINMVSVFWKDYGHFLIELSIFDFFSDFTAPDLL